MGLERELEWVVWKACFHLNCEEENVFQVIRQAHFYDAGLGQAALRTVEFWPLHSQLTEYTLDEPTVMAEQTASLL